MNAAIALLARLANQRNAEITMSIGQIEAHFNLIVRHSQRNGFGLKQNLVRHNDTTNLVHRIANSETTQDWLHGEVKQTKCTQLKAARLEVQVAAILARALGHPKNRTDRRSSTEIGRNRDD